MHGNMVFINLIRVQVLADEDGQTRHNILANDPKAAEKYHTEVQ